MNEVKIPKLKKHFLVTYKFSVQYLKYAIKIVSCVILIDKNTDSVFDMDL